jgi:ribose 5-phosphate isomerase B
MRIAVGADHAGYEAKRQLVRWLEEWGHPVDDLGTHDTEPVDYPGFAVRVARRVVARQADLGILVCGSGIGVSIAANKVRGVRAAYVTDGYSARMARAHNDANVLCLGSRVTGPGLMKDLVMGFLEGAYEGGRHQRRLDQIRGIEEGTLEEVP